MTTMISNLPRDLIEEILSRLPLKFMREMRLTCKKWNSLSKSRSFSKMHIGKEVFATKEGESRVIMLMNYNLYLMSIFLDVDPSTECKGKLTCLSEQVKISKVFHCDGLLLCMLKDDTKVVVWNPYWGQTRWIETRYSYRTQYGQVTHMYKYALGYVNKKNKSCLSHKILRFIDGNLWPVVPSSHFLWYEIYDFDSDLWTTLDVTPQWRVSDGQRGVSLKGNTYWCASEWNEEDLDVLDDHIICFDFTSERFGPLLCMPFSAGHDDYVTISCVGEEKLAALLQHDKENPCEIKIWITTKIEAEKMSWSKFLTVDTKPNIQITPGSFFIDEEKKVAMGFYENFAPSNRYTLSIIGEAGCFSKLDLGERASWAHASSYVPSVVQIKQHAGGKRKKQSNLEKRRCGEKILRLIALEKLEH